VVTGTNAPGTNAVAATNAIAVAKAVAATNALFTAPWMANWHGDIQVGTDLTFSERNRQVFNARSKLTYTKDRFKTILDYDMTYGRSRMEGADEWNVDANRMNGAIKTDFDLAKKWYVYNLAGAGYDEIRRIDLRYEVGPGVGYHLIQRPTFLMNVEAGATYQDEERADGSELSTFYLRFGQNSVWKITPRLTLDEKFEYFPRVSDFEMYRLRFEANLRYALLQNVFVSLSVIDTYDTQTATGVPNNDLQIRSSVGVKF
jgi:putative salt-induced outer membrane protein YdiY